MTIIQRSLLLWPCSLWTATIQGQITTYTYKSRPDLNPVALLVTQPPSEPYTSGYYLTCPVGTGVTQGGPAIYSLDGELVWFGADLGLCFDLQAQNVNGVEALTLWAGGTEHTGWAEDGRALVLNSAYDVVYNTTSRASTGTDFHEFSVPAGTNAATAVVNSYIPVHADLTSVGGISDGYILESHFEEVDIASGQVLFAWNASTHVDFVDSYTSPNDGSTVDTAWDFFHLNAASKDTEGNYLVNSRHYHSIYKISGRTGEVLWTLGGKNSTFAVDDGAEFSWQHHARWIEEGAVLSIFDNDSNGLESEAPNSRGLILDVDVAAMRVSARTEYVHPLKLSSAFEGSTQLLPDGNVVVGWGANPWITEHSADGTVLYAAALGGQDLAVGVLHNYRAFKTTTWRGFPQTWPDIYINAKNVSVSWNGATEVATWEALAGPSTTSLSSALNVSRTGFETTFMLDSAPAFAQVRAYDGKGALLGTSAVRAADGTIASDGFVVPVE